MRPGRLILAVPIASPDSIAMLAEDCDKIVCLAQPRPFFAVGSLHTGCQQTLDNEVVRY